MSGPLIQVALERELVERLCPGAIAEAERMASGFPEPRERVAWVAGRLGKDIEVRLREDVP